MKPTQDNQSEPANKQTGEANSSPLSASKLTPETIKWTPMKKGGFNFRTHTLVRVSDLKMEFRPSITAKLVCGAFASLGFFIPVYHHAVEDIIDSQLGSLTESLLAVGLGCILIFGGFKFWSMIKGNRVFDKSSGRFINNGRDYRSVSLDEIVALQHLHENVKRSDSSLRSSHKRTSFVSNELNLVLRSSNRVHAIDHSNRRKLRDDIESLAEFLGVPVWNHP
ncbi:hypothetical protein [Rhodohalobacter sp. 8-1]|uniref:hypothetical protein n=1 Tax=Rhodohalobacter sp. 8-1 TaxID=3131972 RepID=UPI0030EDDA8B